MGSFIITLKTINRAGIYTRSRDPIPSAPSTRIPREATTGITLEHIQPHGSCLWQRAAPVTGSIEACDLNVILSLQQEFQCEVYKELITGTT